MSFVEDNKTWILPLLGLGAAAVVWFNVRSFSQPATLPGPENQAAQSAPVAPALPASEAPTAQGVGEALWDDLRPLAFVPPDLEARAAFEQQALANLGPEAFVHPAAAQVIPLRWTEPARPQWKATGLPGAAAQPMPQPDFLIEGPGGAKAWFDGHGYRSGQVLKGRPFTVESIRIQPTPKVTFQGSPGSVPRSPRPAPVQEVP